MVTTRFFEEVIDFLTAFPRPEEIVAFRPSETLQQRASLLLDKKREGVLSAEEAHELDYFMILEHLMRMAKARALQKLAAI
jgi:hypothetical protein